MAEGCSSSRLAATDKRVPRARSFAPDCLRGKIALITGGGSGIGMKIAEIFMHHGADIAILSRNESKLVNAAKSVFDDLGPAMVSAVEGTRQPGVLLSHFRATRTLSRALSSLLDSSAPSVGPCELALQALEASTGRRCLPVAADVRSSEAVVSAVETVTSALGCIDILVNAAAGNFLSPASQLSANAFRTVLEIDAVGTFIVSRVVYDAHRKASRPEAGGATAQGGVSRQLCILNVSMTLHYVGALLQAHAGAAKAAVDALTKHLAVEWGPASVRVCGVAPGPIADTEGFKRINPSAAAAASLVRSSNTRRRLARNAAQTAQPSALAEIKEFIPLQRLGAAEDVAYACLFLTLPEASFITGTTLVVDGGQWLTAGNATALDKATRDNWRRAFSVDSKL